MAGTGESRRRWDTDDRFTGVADASAFAAAVDELAGLARRPGWVAEEPEVHLVPHLRRAEVAGLRLSGWRTGDDGVLEAVAEHRPGKAAAICGGRPGRCSGRSPSQRPACASAPTATASSSRS
jgi:hypothetical protein